MRVIEPHQLRSSKKPARSYKKPILIVCIVLVAGYGFYLYKNTLEKSDPSQVTKTETIQPTSENKPKPEDSSKPIKEFTGQQFKDLYYSVAYPNVRQIDVSLSITGNDQADERIRTLAEKRGYKQTAIPDGAIVRIEEPRLNGDDLLQPLAAEGWGSLKAAAKADNIALSIISAYRSPEWQRNLFLERLYSNGISAGQVSDGTVDSIVESTLTNAAVPGYSRHHTGYTIDLWCEDGSGSFVVSSCYSWISANNYLKAKQNGWIPSYPEGTDLQGPEPEPWEYVWVGVNNLK